MDIDLFRKVIEKNSSVEFHFFGSCDFPQSNSTLAKWHELLNQSPNVQIYGLVSKKELACQLNKMDALILCYKADNKNLHGDNSHKIFEYLSTGRVLISTPISLFENNPLVNMSQGNNQLDFWDFVQIIQYNILTNSEALSRKRIELALDNTYLLQLERIETFINGK